MPTSAAGTSPTAESTEKRPPTPSGRSNMGTSMVSPKARRVPEPSSVVKTRWSLRASAPTAASRRSRTTR